MEKSDEQTGWDRSDAISSVARVHCTAPSWHDLVRITVSQARPGMSTPETNVYLISPDTPTQIACANPSCRNGGLDPLPLVRELVQGNQGELRVESCAGRAGRQTGTRTGPRCDTMFCIRLTDDTVYPDEQKLESSATNHGAHRY